MASYSFQSVLVSDMLPGGGLRTLRNGTVTVKSAADDSTVTVVTSDANGLINVTTTDVPSIYYVTDNGFVSDYITAASILVSAGAAALNNDAGVASFVNDSGSATRAALDAGYATKEHAFTVDTDYASLEAALTATATGGTLEVRGAWTRVLPFTVDKACTVRFARSGSITTSVASAAALMPAADDIYLDAPRVFGTGSASSSTGAGIRAAGTLADPITGLRIRAPKVQNFTQNGIDLTFCDDFSIERVRIDDVAYGGIMMSSCSNGEVAGGVIKNVTMAGGLTNAYGIAASYNELAGIASNPQSTDIDIHDVTVDGVPGWEGIDTHAGINIKVHHNTVKNCKVGVAIVPGRNGAGAYVLAPKNCSVSDNYIDSGRSDGALTQGVSFIGCSTGVGFYNNTDWATGSITNNRVYRCGNDAATSGAAVSLQDTLGVVVSGNTFYEPVVSAIRLDYNNRDAVVTGNTAVDVWTNTAAYAVMVQTQSAWNTATVSQNRLARGSKSATLVNSIGLRVGSAIATTVVDQGNDFTSATTPYSGQTLMLRFDQRGIRGGYVTTSPILGVWQQGAQALNSSVAAGGSPGWVCTTAGGASSATWAATTAYSAAAWVKTSTGKVLECVVAGTSSGTEPAPTTIDGVLTDGTVTWVYRSATSAVFKAMPSIAA